MHDEPEDTAARKRVEDGPPEDSAAREAVAKRERLHAIMKAAQSPRNAMTSPEGMALRKLRIDDPARFARVINDRLIASAAVRKAEELATVTSLASHKAKAAPKPPDRPPPSTRPPGNRQSTPTKKLETSAMSKHDRRWGDELIDKTAA